MLTSPHAIEAVVDGSLHRTPAASGVHGLGPLEVGHEPGPTTRWWVANRSDTPVRIRSVSLVRAVTASGPTRMLRHGYQSWSPSGVATLGVDDDPSHANDSGIQLFDATHHADQRRAAPGELRSELVTALGAPNGRVVVLGALGGDRHDTTFRLRPAGSDGSGERSTSPTLRVEAFLGDAVLAPGSRRDLHDVVETDGDDAPDLLDRWAGRAGTASGARIGSPFQVGWCSWYHYFHDVTEADLRSNLALADDWPFEVFQLDDGFQAAIGDWLDTNAKFPSDLSTIAAEVAAAGRTPGLWIAPFLAAPDSEVATAHPEWLARLPAEVPAGPLRAGEPLPGMFNPPWGGGLGGIMWTLDTTHPEVLDHLERVARSLREAGFPYLKLDFTYAPSFDGEYHDPSLTPAERVRAGYDAVRRGAGDDAFLLGCGAPIGHVIGVVDGNRIGSDVAPSWELPAGTGSVDGYHDGEPATLHAYRNTAVRSFQHRRLWLNDPDCLMLRTDETQLTEDQVRTWADAVAVSGGMALVSDDLALLGEGARTLLDEVVAIGRQVDDEARTGPAPRCEDVLDAAPPTTLVGAGHRLVTDPATGTSRLERP